MKKILEYVTNLWYSLVRIGKVKGETLMKSGVNILVVARYLICKFNNDGKKITQLKLQKLLYFIEAYYMAKYEKDKLYDEDFVAWTYGPVSKKVYSEYKSYMDLNIVEENCQNLQKISDDNILESIDKVYSLFSDLSSTQLIKITHRQGSPWFNTPKHHSCTISKKETKDWFKGLFLG